jgi:hypothetical protein
MTVLSAMSFPTRLLVFVLAALGVSVTAAEALKFEVLPTSDNRVILIISDCGRLWRDYQFGPDGKPLVNSRGMHVKKCEPWEEGFRGPGEYETAEKARFRYAGDAAALRSHLEQTNPGFAEVWLVSGGGDVQMGIEIGRSLRRYRVTVRVPDEARLERANRPAYLSPGELVSCVSSCTIAFMGGMFRYKDDSASYEVHSASGVSGGLDDEDRELLENSGLERMAASRFVNARYRARQLLTHFQNTLLLYTQSPQRREDDDAFWQEAVDARGVNEPYTPARKEQDLQRLRTEGVEAAGQDILMRIERDSMQAAIEELRLRLPSLGPRAEPALKMLEAMYDVGILATQSLSKQTMVSMGYLTRDAEP